MLRNFAKELTRIKLGKHWPGRFLKKQNASLTAHYTTAMDSSRKRADFAYKYTLYFELLARKMKEYSLESLEGQDIYNMDEKGFLIEVLSNGKRIFCRQ